MLASVSEHTSIDTVIYLASLASNSRDIEPILDELRRVTSNITPGQVPDKAQNATITQVQQKLEDYLINRDPIRAFTPETLQQSIRTHFANHAPLRRLRWTIAAIWAAAFIASALTHIIPNSLSTDARGQAGGFFFSLVLGSGSAYLFLTALRNFQPELKPAFRLLCIAPFIIGLSQMQLLIAAVFGIGSTPLMRYGGINITFFIAMVCMYYGIRIYAQKLGIRSWATSQGTFWGGAAAVAILTALLASLVTSATRSRAIF